MLFLTPELDNKEKEVVGRIEKIRKDLKYATGGALKWYGTLRRHTFARAIQGSNSIEGINVSDDDAIAAAADYEPEDTGRDVWLEIIGYRDAMTYVLQLADDPHFSFNQGFIRALHFMILSHKLDKNPGKWRPGPIYVHDSQTNEILYEGPPAEEVPVLIHELIVSLNLDDDTPTMVRAAMGHLNLIMIHPFSDGNGRMSRILQTLILSQEGIIGPLFCSVEEYLGRNTMSYYKVLQLVGGKTWNPKQDARPWIQFCLTAHIRQANTLMRRTRIFRKIWNQLDEEIKKHGLPERTIFALSDATITFKVRNPAYRKAAEISPTLASRDFKELVNCGLLIPSGKGRGRSYEASDRLKQIREASLEKKVVDDPFDLGV